jgi:glycosyltransferase involved in cell wall biosynthesis
VFQRRVMTPDVNLACELSSSTPQVLTSTSPPATMGRRGVALLTGGGDKPYAIGLASSLAARGVRLELIGSNELDVPPIRALPGVDFLNLRGDQSAAASIGHKVTRVLTYYLRLLRYAATARPRVFHILWNNRVELFDRTVLMLLYRALGKRLVLTVHNVNAGARDGSDGPLNRISLRIQYALADHLFVHTELMREQLETGFGVPSSKATVIPFGINETVSSTGMTREEARSEIGLSLADEVILFFGNIAPYKGLEYAIQAMVRLSGARPNARLVIAGRPKTAGDYWLSISEAIRETGLRHRILAHTEFVPDEHIEAYFKAADVLVLPYTHVFQSGVLFLGYHFGLPAVVSDGGELRSAVVDGITGFVCRPRDAEDLQVTLEKYFRSPLYQNLEQRRPQIRQFMSARHSWDRVAEETSKVYRSLGGLDGPLET